MAFFTQVGIGVVLMWPALPCKSATTQCSSRILNGSHVQAEKFSPPQATSDHEREHGVVSFASQILAARFGQEVSALIDRKPVANTHANSANAFDTANACGKFGAEQSGISSFICDPPNRSEP
jgi:hypothetical protein